jgi:hypothetical protein
MLGYFCNSLLFLLRLAFSGTACGKADCIHWLLDLQLDQTHPDTSTPQSAIEPLFCEWNKLIFSLPFKNCNLLQWDLEETD